tara:strand:- start:1809 stop:2477 length:669 start_codon:yes stop_codon:yes gene_type:complete
MHYSVQNLNNIKNQIELKLNNLGKNEIPKIIAVSKTFPIEKILPLIEYGHNDFGENKVQETIDKWSQIKSKNNNIKLHLIGKLQSNKVKHAVKIFDYIHSVDNEKLARKIAAESNKNKKKIKIFIQVNIGRENQKSGMQIDNLENFYQYCLNLKLDIVGLMCIPPIEEDPEKYFLEMKDLNLKLKLNELSMGMSSDYLQAIDKSSTFLRIGTGIFGNRNLND